MTLSPPNLIKLFLAPLAVFGALFAVLAALNGGAPSLPIAGDPGAPTGDPVADFQRAVRAAPDNADAYAGLGDAYLARARETGDPGFYTRADRAFDAALRRKPGDLGALIGAGTLAGLRHDFREQLRLGRAALAQVPELARPLPVVADAEIELGRYADAARDIQRLVDTKPGLAAYARASYYRELSGDLPGAIAAMKLAVAAGGTRREPRLRPGAAGRPRAAAGPSRRGEGRLHRRRALLARQPRGDGWTRANRRGGRRSGESRRPPASCL